MAAVLQLMRMKVDEVENVENVEKMDAIEVDGGHGKMKCCGFTKWDAVDVWDNEVRGLLHSSPLLHCVKQTMHNPVSLVRKFKVVIMVKME